MPKLIQNIEGFIYDPDYSEVMYAYPIESEFGEGDYIKVFNYVIFQQDYSRVEGDIVKIPTPFFFGVQSNYNKSFTTIDVSY